MYTCIPSYSKVLSDPPPPTTFRARKNLWGGGGGGGGGGGEGGEHTVLHDTMHVYWLFRHAINNTGVGYMNRDPLTALYDMYLLYTHCTRNTHRNKVGLIGLKLGWPVFGSLHACSHCCAHCFYLLHIDPTPNVHTSWRYWIQNITTHNFTMCILWPKQH